MGSPDAIEKFEFKTMFNMHGGRAIYMMSDGQIPIQKQIKLFKTYFSLHGAGVLLMSDGLVPIYD